MSESMVGAHIFQHEFGARVFFICSDCVLFRLCGGSRKEDILGLVFGRADFFCLSRRILLPILPPDCSPHSCDLLYKNPRHVSADCLGQEIGAREPWARDESVLSKPVLSPS